MLSAISEDGGVFTATLHRSDDTNILGTVSKHNTSVNLTNIFFHSYHYKVYLTASLEGCLCASCFLFGAQIENVDLRTLRNKWKWMKNLTLRLHSHVSSTSTGEITQKEPRCLLLLNSAGGAATWQQPKEKPPWAAPQWISCCPPALRASGKW